MRKRIIASATAGTLLAAATVFAARGPEPVDGCPESLVPAYLPPRALIALAHSRQLPRLLIVNPASGPGAAPVPLTRDAVQAAQHAGARVLGYVHTGWGARDVASVEADVDRFAAWYGTDGIFLDEAAHDSAFVGHYRELAAYARSHGAKVVALNPGVVPARAYFGFADVVVTFEGAYADYAERLAVMPRWLDQLPAGRVAHLVYGASREQALGLGRPASARLYVTSGSLPDPWGALPDYLGDEQTALGGCR